MTLAQDLAAATAGSNAGLALTRLAPPLQGKDWTVHLTRIVDESARKPPVGYEAYFRRLRSRTAAGPAFRRVLVASSLVPTMCGMGERTPGENGLSLHPVYGVPYLPGTSLKGILRAWVMSQDWGPEWKEGGRHFRILFGEGGHNGEAAGVDLLDALPLPGCAMFTLDVLTPHFADYYQDNTGRQAPLGWGGPIPVQFLAAAKGVRYRVVVEGDPAWIDKAAEWLSIALAERGIGAKSRAGYGHFSCVQLLADDKDEQEAAERNAAVRRTRAEWAASELKARGKDALRGEVEKWLRGEPVAASFTSILPVPGETTAPERVLAVYCVGSEWGFKEDWLARAEKAKTDEKKKARARELIAAWDALFSHLEATSAAKIPAATEVTSSTVPAPGVAPNDAIVDPAKVASRFGNAPWVEPKRGMKPNKLADDFANRAGQANAPSRAAVEACLAWLRANGGKTGQFNQVRRAYGLELEPT